MNREEGLRVVCALVAECLEIEPDEVTPDSALIGDLGADSLDFVDLMFRFEGRFGVSILEDEMAFLSGLQAGSPDVVVDGVLAPAVVARIGRWLPDLVAAGSVSPEAFFEAITVEALWRLVDPR